MANTMMAHAVEAAYSAGKVLMSLYRNVIGVDYKSDGSPLTLADRAAHQAIVASLSSSAVPVVSEEGNDLDLTLDRYWLVDPLDGTKDFLAGNDEFTVNVALIEGVRPVLGVVYAPALDELWAGEAGIHAWRLHEGVRLTAPQASRSPQLRIAVSRFHDHPDVDAFARMNGAPRRIPMGSALKYCRLAIADLDVFPRLVGSSEWDTAAGQAVLEAAGGSVLDWHTGEPLRYGKPRRRNPRLLSFRAPYSRADFVCSPYESELL